MKLSISNIAWEKADDNQMYLNMKNLGFSGIEIAPTRLFGSTPYDNLSDAAMFSKALYQEFGLSVCSMQSIWFGITERLFGSKEERLFLVEYTKKAIDFAAVMSCPNLVFGCPKNRYFIEGSSIELAHDFFCDLGNYAASKGTVLALEANPVIYNTNFINTTKEAIELVKRVDSKGFRVNLDLGTVIYNKEDISSLRNDFKYINHIHISEPNLLPLEQRKLHNEVMLMATDFGYNGYFSIEIGKTAIEEVKCSMTYIESCRSFCLREVTS